MTIDVDWLASVLGRPVRETEFSVEPRPTGTLVRVRHETPGLPPRLIVRTGGRPGDVAFYRDVAGRIGARCALCLAAGLEPEPWRVLVDLSADHRAFDIGDLPAVVHAFADLHRPLPDGLTPPDDPVPWLWARAAESWPAFRAAVRPSTEEVAAFEALLTAPPTRPGLTVVLHGDAHPGNVLVGPDGATFVDWEDWRVGPGAEDLAFFLADLPSSERRARAPEAIARYSERVGRDVTAEIDAAWDQCAKMSVFWAWLEPERPGLDEPLRRQWRTWAELRLGIASPE